MDIILNLIQVFFTSIGSIIVLFALTKLIGCKQISELNMFDYINGITIGSIAAEMATSLESDFLMPLFAMVIYGLTAFLLSYISSKSVKARKFINGTCVILFKNDKFYYNNFKKSRLDMNEFLSQCKSQGYFDLSEVYAATLEPNGKLSILPKEKFRNVLTSDLDLTVSDDNLPINLIIDGVVLEDNLKLSGFDKNYLIKNLNAQGIKNFESVLLCYVKGKEITAFSKDFRD